MRYAPDAPSHYVLDMQRLTRALERYVVELPGGWEGVSPDAPEDITRPYMRLFSLGMANGWLVPERDGRPSSVGGSTVASEHSEQMGMAQGWLVPDEQPTNKQRGISMSNKWDDEPTTFTVEYDQMIGNRHVITDALTGDDRDALLAAEQAFNEAAERITGVNPGVRFDLSLALRRLVRDRALGRTGRWNQPTDDGGPSVAQGGAA